MATRFRAWSLVLTVAMLPAVWPDAVATGQTVPSAPSMVRVYQGTATAPSVTVTVSPASATVAPGGTVQFQAAVTGTPNTAVVWSATGGTISPTGLFTAGSATGTYRVTATVSGGTYAGTATVAIQSSSSGSYVDISPGQNIQAALDALPAGATLRLRAGVHRLTAPLTPRSGSIIVGEAGAVLSGARLLTSFVRSGSYWVASGQTQQSTPHGTCQPDRPRCNLAEDLYIDDVMLQHVSSLSQVGPGKWYFDYGADQIYIADDPTGRRVETTVVRHAFGGSASNVTIANLTIEKFANPAQWGAIQGDSTTNWTVQDNIVRFNHGVGIRIGNGMKVLRNNVYRNGQQGIGGVGNGVLVEGNEIAWNNTAGYEAGWEAGGTKFAVTRDLVVRGNFVHHNDGPGLWTDIDNIYTLYENNVVEDNRGIGIFHEISYDAVIRRNTVRRNGLNFTAWLWGAGILVAASPNVEIYENIVEDNGNGITAVQQNRGTGRYGPWLVQNFWAHHNTVRMRSGLTGIAQDTGDTAIFTSRNNRFTDNTYYLGSSCCYFAWNNQTLNESGWNSYGHDIGGTFNR